MTAKIFLNFKQLQSELVRLKINISNEEAEIIFRLTHKEGISVTELIRRMISVCAYLDQRVDNNNTVLRLFNTKTKKVTNLHLV